MNRFPGEGAIRTIPDVVLRFFIHPIPRALWNNKPVDPVWAWYNELVTGEATAGTTVASGLVGWFYMRFGVAGVIEGALLWGWLARRAERGLQYAEGQPLRVMLSLGFLVWMFRCFRDLHFVELYPLVLATIVLWVVLKVFGVGVSRQMEEN